MEKMSFKNGSKSGPKVHSSQSKSPLQSVQKSTLTQMATYCIKTALGLKHVKIYFKCITMDAFNYGHSFRSFEWEDFPLPVIICIVHFLLPVIIGIVHFLLPVTQKTPIKADKYSLAVVLMKRQTDKQPDSQTTSMDNFQDLLKLIG